MKKQVLFFFLILTMLAFLVLSCGGNGEKNAAKEEDTYPQHMLDALEKAGDVSVNYRIDYIIKAIDSFYADNERYPETLDELVPSYVKVETELNDPWGTKLRYENKKIISAGKDKTFGTNDDIDKEI